MNQGYILKGLIFSLFFQLSAFANNGCNDLIKPFLADETQRYHKVEDLLALSNKDLHQQNKALKKQTHYLIERLDRTKVLNGDDLQELNKNFDKNLRMLQALDHRSQNMAKQLKYESIPEVRKKKIIQILAMEFDALDNYLDQLMKLQKHQKFRRLLNKSDLAMKRNKNQLQQIAKNILANYRIKNIHQYLMELDQLGIRAGVIPPPGNSEIASLMAHLNNSYIMRIIGSKKELWSLKINNFLTALRDISRKSIEEILYWANKVVGDFSVFATLRKGRLYNRPEVFNHLANNTLKPLDILVDRASFKITDKIIPGHYGHAALWLGNKKQIKELGLWDHPMLIPLREQIENGQYLLEARSDGVKLRKLTDFLNTDSLSVIRRQGLNQKAVKNGILERGLIHLDKPFDYNFDIEQTNAFICTKVIYEMFGDIRWETRQVMGRHAFPPNNIPRAALEGKHGLKIIAAYEDGVRLQGDLHTQVQALLKAAE